MSDISEFATWEQENRSLEAEQASQLEQRRREFNGSDGRIVMDGDSSDDWRSESGAEEDEELQLTTTKDKQIDNEDELSEEQRMRRPSAESLKFGTREVFDGTFLTGKRYPRNTRNTERNQTPTSTVPTLHNRTPAENTSTFNRMVSGNAGSEDEEGPDYIAPPSSQPRRQNEAMQAPDDEDPLQYIPEKDQDTMSFLLNNFEMADGQDGSSKLNHLWDFAKAPLEEINNIRRLSADAQNDPSIRHILEDERIARLALCPGSTIGARRSSAAIDEFNKETKTPQRMAGGRTTKASDGFSAEQQERVPLSNMKSLIEKVEQFVEGHTCDIFAANTLANFEQDVYKFAREVGMGPHVARVEVMKARAAYKRKLGLGDGKLLDIDDEHHELSSPSPEVVRKAPVLLSAVDYYENQNLITSPKRGAKRKLVDMPEAGRDDVYAKRKRKAEKKARKKLRKLEKQTKLSKDTMLENGLDNKMTIIAKDIKEDATIQGSSLQVPASSAKFRQSKEQTSNSGSSIAAAGLQVLFGHKPADMTNKAWKNYKKQHRLEHAENAANVVNSLEKSLAPSVLVDDQPEGNIGHYAVAFNQAAPVLPKTISSSNEDRKKRKKKRNHNRLPSAEIGATPTNILGVPNVSIVAKTDKKIPQEAASSTRNHHSSSTSQPSIEVSRVNNHGINMEMANRENHQALTELHDINHQKPQIARRDRGRQKQKSIKPTDFGVDSQQRTGKALHS
jgi:hypothetical protein